MDSVLTLPQFELINEFAVIHGTRSSLLLNVTICFQKVWRLCKIDLISEEFLARYIRDFVFRLDIVTIGSFSRTHPFQLSRWILKLLDILSRSLLLRRRCLKVMTLIGSRSSLYRKRLFPIQPTRIFHQELQFDIMMLPMLATSIA